MGRAAALGIWSAAQFLSTTTHAVPLLGSQEGNLRSPDCPRGLVLSSAVGGHGKHSPVTERPLTKDVSILAS